MVLIYPAGAGGRIYIAGRLFIATYEAVGQNILVLVLKRDDGSLCSFCCVISRISLYYNYEKRKSAA